MNWDAIVIASVPLLVAIFGYLANKRNIDKKASKEEVSSIVEDTEKIRKVSSDLITDAETYWKKKFEDQEKEHKEDLEKLRQKSEEEGRAERAPLLVEIASLKEKNAELNGIIQGVTGDIYQHPGGGRRSNDK